MNQKGSTPLLILLGIVLVIGIAGGVYILVKPKLQNSKPTNPVIPSQSSQPITPQPAPISGETADWQTLTSDICHLSLKYPKNWNGKVNEGNGCAFEIKNPNVKVSYFLLNTLAPNVSWESIINENKDSKDTLIGGQEGLIAKAITDKTGDIHGIYFHSQNYIYSITYFIANGDTDTENIYNKIISSIKFLDQK